MLVARHVLSVMVVSAADCMRIIWLRILAYVILQVPNTEQKNKANESPTVLLSHCEAIVESGLL